MTGAASRPTLRLMPAKPSDLPDLATIGGRLRHARHLRGEPGKPVPTKPLSMKAGLSPSAVSFIESHPDTDVRCGNILALAELLDVSPAWLAWGLGPMDPFPTELKGQIR